MWAPVAEWFGVAQERMAEVLPNLANFQLDEHIVRTETMFHMSPPTPSPSMPSLPPPFRPPPREDDVLFNLAGLDVTMLHVYIVTGSALLAACVLLSVTRAGCALRSMCRRRTAERPVVPTTAPSLGRPSDGEIVGSMDLWYHGVIASLEKRAKSRITVSSLHDRARVGAIAVEMGSAPSSAASVQLRV